ncbi:threonine/serine ThrE exporter family protein [Cellulomonas endophytica]|uniref:threonine/serine ThrE exporter family protein n=1 Tax=Cellulomonas endophytica TaxID=2494735 RepID=UPI001011B1F1|nr:threonine/serine exporter family protein [Cellulomonas endophytica]
MSPRRPTRRRPGAAPAPRLRRLVTRGAPPTRPVPAVTHLDPATLGDVLGLGLRVGEAMAGLGASALEVTTAVRGVVRAFGARGTQVDLTFTSITVSDDRGPGGVPLTVVRIVESRSLDYGRLQRVAELARELGAVPVPPDEVPARLAAATARLEAVLTAPRPYRRGVVTAAVALLAAAVAVLLGGGPAVALVAALTSAGIDRVVLGLARAGLPPFFQQVGGAAVAALVAVGLFLALPVLPVDPGLLPPSLVVASGIVVLLAGLQLVGAVEDGLTGFPITAGARSFESVVLTLGIVVGIAGVLDVARRAGVPLVLRDPAPVTAPLAVQVLAAAAASLAWAVACWASGRAVLAATVVGGLGWAVLSGMGALGAGAPVASAAAATVVGFTASTAARRLGAPALVTGVCAIVPLLPGLAVYRGLFGLVDAPTADALLPGFAALLEAALIGLGLAAGVTLGELLAQPLVARRGTRRTARAALPGG